MKRQPFKEISTQDVAANIVKHRVESGMTQVELGQRLGVTPQRICNIERAVDKTFTLRLLNQLAEVFEVETPELLRV